MNEKKFSYRPGTVERIGRRIKLEYVGMASVFAIVALLFFGTTSLPQSLIATLGTFFLFLGVKKKTRDHLSASLLLFASAAVAREAVGALDWAVPFAAFGACVYILERCLEKQRATINTLPAVFVIWSLLSPSWPLGIVYAATYLLHPWPERSPLRRRLFLILGLSLAVGVALSSLRFGLSPGLQRQVPGSFELTLLACLAVPSIASLIVYWPRLAAPRRWNAVIFGLLSPWDPRLAALFGMVAAVVLSATVFRHSVDSDRLRPWLKHAEWHFFWYVAALAAWMVASV